MRTWFPMLVLVLLPLQAAARNSLVTSMPGVSGEEASALRQAGVKDTRRLYQRTRGDARRLLRLARKTGLARERLAHLAGLADLCRLYRVTPRIAELLARAGVRSLSDLSRQDAAALAARTTTINEAERLTEHPPTERQLAGWIRDAGRLKPEDWEQLRAWARVR